MKHLIKFNSAQLLHTGWSVWITIERALCTADRVVWQCVSNHRREQFIRAFRYQESSSILRTCCALARASSTDSRS